MIGVWLDKRIGGIPRWRVCDDGELMRLPEVATECVCFIRAEWTGQKAKVATAFFVAVRLGTEPVDSVFTYAVTARHCLENDQGELADSVALSLNLRAGGIGELDTDPALWVRHSTADVAILPIGYLNNTRFKFKIWDMRSTAATEFVQERQIGPGDDVYFSGLLVHHPGRTQIQPIARIGNIAAMPVDPIQLTTGEDTVALVEARSVGGLSGSPVFLHLPFFRDQPEGIMTIVVSPGGANADSGGDSRLFGVMHGFYPVRQNDPDHVSGGDENLNTGIAVVVLVDRILELLNKSDQVRERDDMKKRFEEATQSVPIPTSTEPDTIAATADLLKELLGVSKDDIEDVHKGHDQA